MSFSLGIHVEEKLRKRNSASANESFRATPSVRLLQMAQRANHSLFVHSGQIVTYFDSRGMVTITEQVVLDFSAPRIFSEHNAVYVPAKFALSKGKSGLASLFSDTLGYNESISTLQQQARLTETL
jgi:hypothetical protein